MQIEAYRSCRHPHVQEADGTLEAGGCGGILSFPPGTAGIGHVRSHQELLPFRNSSLEMRGSARGEYVLSGPADQIVSLPPEGHLGGKLWVHLVWGWVPGASCVILSGISWCWL